MEKEIKVNETFTIEGQKYIVKIGKPLSCAGCVFSYNDDCKCPASDVGECSADYRTDKQDVIFKKYTFNEFIKSILQQLFKFK